jgi:hypothetical protein
MKYLFKDLRQRYEVNVKTILLAVVFIFLKGAYDNYAMKRNDLLPIKTMVGKTNFMVMNFESSYEGFF